ncbi:MAG: hypothetical protein NZ553_10770, partial [Caldilinea sp.]|nr:hypothetical protein [Caldilinea sp.]MDW8440945.1 hypothetical protein [Caldilineaceae bacterium]
MVKLEVAKGSLAQDARAAILSAVKDPGVDYAAVAVIRDRSGNPHVFAVRPGTDKTWSDPAHDIE